MATATQVAPKVVSPKSLGSKLLPGKSIREGEMLVSPQGHLKAILSKGRFYVTKDGKQIWGGWGNGNAVRGTMQQDSNFVIYDAKNGVIAATDTTPWKGCFLVADETNLMVVDSGGTSKWDIFSGTATRSAWSHISDTVEASAKWTANAASVAGRSMTHVIATGIKSAGELAGKIPIVGAPLHGILALTSGPFTLIDSIAHGARIDHALLAEYQDKISAIREVAPYAKMVVGAIPGLGSGVSAALAFSVALASGMPIDKALIEGVTSAVPYGALAKTVLNYTQKVVSGENVVKATVDAGLSQLPVAARSGLELVQRAVKGENIPKVALEQARKALPTEAQAAFDIGVAIGQGKNLQRIVTDKIVALGPAELAKFAATGQQVIQSTPVFQAAASLAKNAAETQGFQVGVSVLNYSGVNAASVEQFRNKLTVQARVGFDLAVSTRIGKVVSKPAPAHLTGVAAAAYYTTHGMAGAAPKQKTAMIRVVAANPKARPGAAVALAARAETKRQESWWHKLMHAMGLA